MSVPSCPLCPPNMGAKERASLSVILKEEDEEAALRFLESVGIETDFIELHDHLKYHRPESFVLPRRSRKKDLREGMRLPKRAKASLVLLARQRALSAETMAWAIYGGRDSSSKRVARRDLQRMLSLDFVYRVYPEHIRGAGPRPRKKPPGIFLLGPGAKPYLATVGIRGLKKGKDYFTASDNFKDWREPYRWFEQGQEGASLFQDLLYKGPNWELEIDPKKWWDKRVTQFRFKDKLRGGRRCLFDGLFITRYSISGVDSYLPIFYMNDWESKPPEDILLRADALAGLHRSGQLPRFGSHGRGMLLIITRSPKRALELQQKANKYTWTKDNQILATDYKTAAESTPWDRVWYPLNRPDRGSIVESASLIHQYNRI